MPDWRNQGRERVKEKTAGNSIKLREGENCIRILPDKKDLMPDGKLNPKGVQNSPIREIRIHQEVGPDKGMCGCGKSIDGTGKCWLCDIKIPDLESKKKMQLAVALEAREKFIVQATMYDADTEKFSTPKPWWVSAGAGIPGKASPNSLAVRVYQKIVSSKKDYVDPIKGYNLNITRTGEGMKTRYTELEGDESPTKVPLDILKQVKDLDKIIPQYSEEDQKSLYFGRPKEEEEEEKPKRRGRKDEEVEEDDSDEEDVEKEESESEDESESDVEDDPDEVTEEEEEEKEESEEEETEVEEEEEIPEEEEEEEETPKPKKKATPTKKSAPPEKKASVKKSKK
jgi:hypothetical protein